MRARLTMIAALIAMGSAASAEPQKVPARPAPQPAKIVLASADPVRAPTPVPVKSSAAPAKRPAGRVTTCRCGDPVSEADSQDQ